MNKRSTKATMTEPKLSRASERAIELAAKFQGAAHYNPYKVFDSRRGCMVAVTVCIFLIIVFALNVVLNGNWPSLVMVPVYGLIIRNRLRKLKAQA
jgi:hypothetical protein